MPRPGLLGRAGRKPVRLAGAAPDRWSALSFPLRIFLIVAGGLFLGLAAVLTGFFTHVTELSAQGSCTMSGSGATLTANITLASGTTLVEVQGGKLLVQLPGDALGSCSGTGGTNVLGGTGGIQAIQFALATPAPNSVTLDFDQTTGSIPCNVAVSGTVGNGTSGDGLVEIVAHAGTDVTVGASTIDTSGCGAGHAQGSLKGVGNYLLVANNGAEDLSALGDSSDPTTVPVTFQAGRTATAGDIESFDSSAAGSTTLDFSHVDQTCPSGAPTCALVINSSAGPTTTTPIVDSFNAQLNERSSATQAFTAQTTYDFSNGGSNVTQFLGLPVGPTTFHGESGNFTLNSLQPGSQVIAGTGTESYTVTASNTIFTSGAASDTFAVTGNGNTFQAKEGPDNFYDTVPGGAQPSNVVDFSDVGTSSGAPLSVNASGGPQPITVNGSACPSPLANGAAAVGCTAASWTFLNSVGSNSASAFPTILGATTGSTAFLAGGTGGLTLNGQGTGNSATFLGNTGVVANLSGGPEITSAQIGASTTLSNFNLGLGQVLVSPPQGSGNTCVTTPGGDCDTLGGAVGSIATVTGPTSGFSTFYAGAGPGTSTIRDDGNNNTFIGGSGPDAFSSAGNNNTFVAGSGSATFSESTSVQGANNTINFGAAPAGSVSGCAVQPCSLEVNVSGSPTAVSDFSAAVTDKNGGTVATYNFGTGGSDFTTLIGATGGNTTFDGGLGSYTYTGKGAGNTLNFADVTSGITPLTFDVTHIPLPLATLANVPETFSGITNLVGLPGPQGNTTFIGGANGGYTFSGNGSNNQASFSSQGPSTTLSVSGLHDASPNSTGSLLTGGTVTFSLPTGAVVCPSVPVVNGSASCFSSSLPTPAPPSTTDQVVAIYNPPAGSGLSGAGFILSATGSGAVAAAPTSVTGVQISQSSSATTFSAGTPLQLAATVSTLNQGTALPAGTLTFSVAGGQTLCTATVNAVAATTGSTSTETASCPGTFPPGTFDVLAVYAPSTTAVGASVGAYGGNQVTFTSSEVQSTTTLVGYTSSLNGVTCDGSFSPVFFDCASATIQVPNAQSATYSGSVTFSEPDGTALCTVTNVTVGAAATTVTCSPLDDGHVAVPTGTQVVATFMPATVGAVSSSAGVFGPTVGDPFITALTPTSTSLSISPGTIPAPSAAESVIAGTQETLTATVNSSANPLPAGGQVVFGVASGSPLCSVGVPGGAPPATVQCQTSFPTAAYQDVTATYLPPAGSGLGPSAFDQPVDVNPSDNATGTENSVSAAHAGVAVNLGTTAVVTGAQSPIPGVSVGGGQVLVAAPTGAATCAGSPLPSFCDSITNATTVMGSSGGDNTFVAGPGSEMFGDTGAKGGDSIDFSGLSTGAGSALAVNVAGPGLPSLPNFTANLGTTATYNFATGGSNFTNFIGSAGGNTTFYAGKAGGYSFTGSGSGNTVDFSQTTANPAVTVDLSKGTSSAGSITGFANGLADAISGLTTVTGSPNGGNSFTAGPGPAVYTFTASGNGNAFTGGAGTDVFNSTGSNNHVTVGTGSATFTDSVGSNNEMDFSHLPPPGPTLPAGDAVTVNVSGFQDGATQSNQATGALGGVYTFGASTTTFDGSPGGSTFDAGGTADTFNGNAAAANNILSFANFQSATVGLKVCVIGGTVNGTTCQAGQTLLGSVPTAFTNITTYKGLPTGNTTFVAGTPSGSTFSATSGTLNNSIDYSAASTGVTVNLGATPYVTGAQNPIPGVTVGSGQVLGVKPPPGQSSCATSPLPSFCDSIANLTTVTGSSSGANTFVAGSSSENFGDTGSKGGDSIDFSGLSTNSGSPLAVNVAGPAVGALPNFTATLGTTATYNFTTGGSNFTNFTASASGNTTFYGGKVGGYSFTGSGSGNTVDFSQTTANPAVTVDLSKGISSPGSITGFANGLADAISGLTTVTGSPNGGNSFKAGPGPATYTFTASGNNNVFAGGAGTDVFNSTGSNNLVTVGTGSATFTDTVGSGNQMDFSQLPAPSAQLPAGDPVVVNVSGFQDGSTQNNQATGALGGVYTFGASTTTFKGSPGGSTFDAGGAGDTFNGIAGAPSNILSFANVQSATVGLKVCVVSGTVNGISCPPGEAFLGSVPTAFTNITTYKGLLTGNTTFVAGTPSGTTFSAASGTSNNSIDYSAAAAGVTVNLAATPGTVGPSAAACAASPLPSSCDSIANLTTVTGSSKGGNTFLAGSGAYNFTGNGNGNTFSGGPGASTFSSNGNGNVFNVGTGPDTMSDNGSGNSISFKAVPTSATTLLNVNISSTPVNGLLTDTASAGPVTYTFTNGGSGFTNFTGANNGFTYFDAAATGGYRFTGIGSNNTLDFNTDPSGIVANTQTGTVCVSNGACTASSTDPIADITTIIGSTSGANVFDGDLTGATFKSASAVNTVSYVGYTNSGLCFNLTTDQVTPGPTCGVSSPADTFKFSNPNGTSTIEGTPQSDTFQPGAAGAAIQGGGGNDILDLTQIPAPPSGATGVTGAAVDLDAGSITLPAIAGSGTTTFLPGCGASAPATDLCLMTVNGSRYNDTFTANRGALSGLPALFVQGGTGSDSLNLADIQSPATINMPVTSGSPPAGATTCAGGAPGGTGVVCANNPVAGAKNITFKNILTVTGTANGGDTFFAGSGTESLTENGTPGTLDYSDAPLSGAQGISVEADATGANPTEPGGTVVIPSLGVTDTFVNMGTFNGTAGNDSFSQVGAGNYFFNGGSGSNTLNLSLAPAGTQVSLRPPAACPAGTNNNDGSATGTGVDDNFTCMGSVIVPSTSVYTVLPGETATVNGNGSGTLVLDCMGQCATAGAATGVGVTVTMPTTAGGSGRVTGDGYNFAFTGMSTVDGTPYNDLFTAGASSVTINGGPPGGPTGNDGVSFAAETAGEVVNLSSSSYTVPSGLTDAGATVPADTAVGGNGGTITLNGISNVRGTATGNDVIVAGPGPGTIVGGSGSDTFVPTGGNDVISGGSSTNTLDLSLLPSYSTFNLGSAAVQQLGAGNGTLAVLPGTIQKAIASPSGSSLQAGPGNITLIGGQGNDWLAAGTGTQTLIAGTGHDTLVAGNGTDTLQGGSQPVTFVPGVGRDTLTSTMSAPGNTLSYQGAPSGVLVNLANDGTMTIPSGPFAGTSPDANSAVGGWGASVDLTNAQIKTVTGSPQADTFITGSTPDIITGNGGNDLFMVNSGGNNLTAGDNSASTFLFNAAGSNIINGGGSSTVDFSQAPAGVNVHLQVAPATGSASGGFGGTQKLLGIQTVVGTNYPDTLIAAAPGQTLTGLDSQCLTTNPCADLLQAAPTGGDTLTAIGSATFCAQVGCDKMTQAAGGNTMTGGAGSSTFFAQNGGKDTISGHFLDVAYVDSGLDVVTGIPPQNVNP